MKTLFVEAKNNISAISVLSKLRDLPKRIGLVSTIQYLHQLPKLKDELEKKGHLVLIGGQIIGCNVSNALKILKDIDTYLYIGSGEFHPVGVAYKSKKKVIIANPATNQVSYITDKEIKDFEDKRNAKVAQFILAKKIGIIVTIKPGQENLRMAINFRRRLKKDSFIFLTNEVRPEDLDNFREIDFWVNTACPRIEMPRVLWINDIPLEAQNI